MQNFHETIRCAFRLYNILIDDMLAERGDSLDIAQESFNEACGQAFRGSWLETGDYTMHDYHDAIMNAEPVGRVADNGKEYREAVRRFLHEQGFLRPIRGRNAGRAAQRRIGNEITNQA